MRLGACLSLTGRYARFGTQAHRALQVWSLAEPDVELVVLDDASSPDRVAPTLRELSPSCDLLLGPYSTRLMRAANRVAPELGTLLWNHGGSGDDVEGACPGRVVSILTPTSGYAQPFVRMLARRTPPAPLLLVSGPGPFARQVIDGAVGGAARHRLATIRGTLLAAPRQDRWDLFCAGSFERDVETVRQARALPNPPRVIGTVAAGVSEFADALGDPDGVYGVAQWLPGQPGTPGLGPTEDEVLLAYRNAYRRAPDYPGMQALAAAVVATHCARSGGPDVASLWRAATRLHTSTAFGAFGVDPVTGTQMEHSMVLGRWDGRTLIRAD
jgi:ABC-type branched-subunit amino acid transport system substrate-binding protein